MQTEGHRRVACARARAHMHAHAQPADGPHPPQWLLVFSQFTSRARITACVSQAIHWVNPLKVRRLRQLFKAKVFVRKDRGV